MDDANLSKLTLSHKGIKPNFSNDIISYEIDVPCSLDNLSIKASTSDKGASFVVKNETNKTFGSEVKLVDGDNKIVVEVTSEDGTIKKYSIKCKRLSASDANLNRLTFLPLSKGSLEVRPAFDSAELEYLALVDFNVTEIKFGVEVLDSGCDVEVFSGRTMLTAAAAASDTEQQSDGQVYYTLGLNFGFTNISVRVCSPDKSKTQTYVVEVFRAAMPKLCSFVHVNDKIDFEDGLSLGPVYAACSIDRVKVEFSYPFAEFFFKVAHNDQLSLVSQCAPQSARLEPSAAFESRMSNSSVRIPCINGESSKETPLKAACLLVDEVNSLDVTKPAIEAEIKAFDPNKIAKPRNWEKQLQIIYDETDGEKLARLSKGFEDKYLAAVGTVTTVKEMKRDSNDTPLYFLNMAIFNLATSLKFSSKDQRSHFKLAALLEEKSFIESLYGFEKKHDEEIKPTLSLMNKAAVESSKEEEIDAIAKSRNVAADASDAEKLKALDQEYHYLMENGQGPKAEQVQLLYQFKAKKISTAHKKGSVQIADTSDCQVQANQKYQDGVSIVLEHKLTNFQSYFNLGRSFCMIGDYEQAVIYLKPCINWTDLQYQTLARFYFGYAVSKRKELLDVYYKNTFSCMSIGLQHFLSNISKSFSNRNLLLADDRFSIFNTVFLDGFNRLGRIKVDFSIKAESISSEDAYKYSAWLCCLALSELDKRTTVDQEMQKSSRLINEIVRILIEAHYNLINLPTRIDPTKMNEFRTLRAKRCVNLLNIIRTVTNRETRDILDLQENVAHALVYSDPLESYHLVLLCAAKLELYDYLAEFAKDKEDEQLKELLDESKIILNIAIEKTAGNQVPAALTELKWWKKFDASERALQQQQAQSAKGDKNKPLSGTKKPSAAAPAAAKKPAALVAPAAKLSTAKAPAAKTADPKATTVVPSVDVPAVGYVKKESSFDRKILQTQCLLLTARVFSRLNDSEKAKNFYEQVIKSEPRKQDGYVELASMLKTNGDLMGAVDVYARYPVVIEEQKKDENGSGGAVSSGHLRNVFRRAGPDSRQTATMSHSGLDDAFICGEVVTIIMNSQKYDDPRLAKYLIFWARIMGIAIIEKYISILDKANKTKVCKEVYCGVHKKSLDDPDLAQFFKFKGWL